MPEIREMRAADLPEVVKIEESIFSVPWSKRAFESSLNEENTIYLVSIVDGEIAGYCGLLCVLDEGDITNVAVKDSFRKRGVASRMLQELLDRASKRGITAFTLEVRESNAAAIALYEKLGFENCGIRKNFYEKPTENAVIMWKR